MQSLFVNSVDKRVRENIQKGDPDELKMQEKM